MNKRTKIKDVAPAVMPKVEKNEFVVYQPDETLRLEVKLEDETVWLTQSQMAELFGCTTRNVRLHLENIYACGELEAGATRKDFFLVRQEGVRQVKRNGSLKDACEFKRDCTSVSTCNASRRPAGTGEEGMGESPAPVQAPRTVAMTGCGEGVNVV